MLKGLVAFVVANLSVVASTATAQEADLRQITCKDFMIVPQEQRAVILAFLAGYYAGRCEPPII
jgi:hypothetical protein